MFSITAYYISLTPYSGRFPTIKALAEFSGMFILVKQLRYKSSSFLYYHMQSDHDTWSNLHYKWVIVVSR